MSKSNTSHQLHALSARSLAAIVCRQVIEKGQSLDEALFKLPQTCEKSNRAFIQKLSFGVIRWYWQLDSDCKSLLKKPPRNKDSIIRFIILVGIYQLKYTDIPHHAAVSATVTCCEELKKKWSTGLVNACLRGSLRDLEKSTSLDKYTNDQAFFSHPQWLAAKIHTVWPEQAKQILQANNQQAEPCLRVNTKLCKRDDYLEQLNGQGIKAKIDPYSPIGIRLSKSIPVSELPNFNQAWVTMQDTASQFIATFFTAKKNHHVLDACAAPGGKTTLLLEQSDETILVDALDISGKRNQKLSSTLSRFQSHRVRIIKGDASKPETWWDGKAYDRILLDVPCSGLGVIRRHPDIKHHRSPDDIIKLKNIQQQLLQACWKLLKPGGELLYTTCSILPEENVDQIIYFIQQKGKKNQVEHLPITHPTAFKQQYGVQTLPGISDMDGFYYCHLRKAVQ